MISSQWTRTGIERIGSGLLEARGEDVLKWLKTQGVVVPSDTRLRRAVDRLKSVNNDDVSIDAMSDGDAALLLNASRDVFDAFLIAWAAVERKRRLNVFPNDRLSYLLSGTDSPATDADPKSRNTQFELVAGAHLILGGADLIPEEPDYSLLYHGRRVGVAVKRLTSLKPAKVNDRMREAVRQLEDSFGEGFVVVNLDGWIADLTGEDASVVGEKFREQLQSAYPEIVKIARRKESLLGIIIMGTWARWMSVAGARALEWHSPFQFIGFTDSDADEAKFYEYMVPLRERWSKSITEMAALIQRAP